MLKPTALLLGSVLAASAAAGTRTVGGPAATHATLPEALAAAAPGDTIVVRGGLHAGVFTLDVPDLALVGVAGPVLAGDGADPVVTIAADGVTVAGFEIRGGAGGISARDVCGAVIRRNRVRANAGVGIDLSGRDCVIARNEVCGNDHQGIVLGRGADPTSTWNRIEDNEVRDNGRAGGSEPRTSGILLRDAARNRIDGNVCAGHGHGAGFFVNRDASHNRFADNRAVGNHGTDGFHIDGDDNTFLDNAAEGNASDGFDVDGDRNRLRDNRARSNAPGGTTGDGFDVRGAWNRLVDNRAADNTDEGFEVQGDDATLEYNAACRNGGDGFDFGSLAERNLVRANAAGANGDDGFETSGRDHVFRRNASEDNGGFGYVDDSTGGGTAGTASTYLRNRCAGNAAGASEPADLCTPGGRPGRGRGRCAR